MSEKHPCGQRARGSEFQREGTIKWEAPRQKELERLEHGEEARGLR